MKYRGSPYQVTYDDLVTLSEQRLMIMEKTYPGKVMTNQMNSWTATHRIEAEKKLLKILKKFKKDPQTDLFNEFEKVKGT